jgi:hypothetical protein
MSLKRRIEEVQKQLSQLSLDVLTMNKRQDNRLDALEKDAHRHGPGSIVPDLRQRLDKLEAQRFEIGETLDIILQKVFPVLVVPKAPGKFCPECGGEKADPREIEKGPWAFLKCNNSFHDVTPNSPRKYATAYELAHPEIGRMCEACVGMGGVPPKFYGNSLKEQLAEATKRAQEQLANAPHLFTPDLVGKEIEHKNLRSVWVTAEVVDVAEDGMTAWVTCGRRSKHTVEIYYSTEWRLVPTARVLVCFTRDEQGFIHDVM